MTGSDDHDNVYWAFDGLNGNIVRYDFVKDHGPGGSDHSDGIVRRYLDAKVTRTPEVPSHMAFDSTTGLLYIADTGSGRIMRLDTTSGHVTGPLPMVHEGIAEYSKVEGAAFDAIATGLHEPSGIVLVGDRLFVTEHATGDIVALSLDGHEVGRATTGAKGIMGITVGPEGALWYVDAAAQTVVRIDP